MTTEQPAPSGDPEFKLSRGAVFPLIGGRSVWAREHLLPILATIVVAIALTVIFDPKASGKDEIGQAWSMYFILGIYIAFMVNYYISEMCGSTKRLWVLAAVAGATLLLMQSPLWHLWAGVFYNVIPGAKWEKSPAAAAKIAGYFFGTGLCEEGFKALPLLVLALLGGGLAWLCRHTKGRFSRFLAGIKKRVALCEPIDGIVFGVASGSGFFLNETLGQYVPGIMGDAKYAGSQAFDGLVLLLVRGLPDLAEHSAWAGLFGYFIGLSALRPRMAFALLPLGWFSAAALHGAWDASADIFGSAWITLGCWLFIALFSYALLAGAIFKAREISPSAAGAKIDAAGAAGKALPAVP
jgi:RsiW-degrading membrane proteinase PrsW (M82 family)